MEVDGAEGQFPLTHDLASVGGALGLRARGLTARFQYAIVIE